MDTSILINFFYIVSAILFIYGIKMLGSAGTARRGNRVSSIGMLIAVIVTLIDNQVFESWVWIVAGIGMGSLIGFVAAKKVQMTSMPELVALFNGFGGLASLFVGWAEFQKVIDAKTAEFVDVSGSSIDSFTASAVFLAVIIGGVTFTGSVYAWGKLSGKISGQAKIFAGQKAFNMLLALGMLVSGVLFASTPGADLAFIYFLVFMVLS